MLILVVAALPPSDVPQAGNEFDRLDPFDLPEAKFNFVAPAQGRSGR
jgi:hypothetical protein